METKECTKCFKQKPLIRFSKRMTTTGYRLRGECKDCRNKKLRESRDDARREYERNYKRRGPSNVKKQEKTADDILAQNRAWYFRTNYGISVQDYQKLLDQQNNSCAICGISPDIQDPNKRRRVLFVDHCHISGNIRGLLCSSCNLALGGFKEDTDLVKRALEYLLDNDDHSK